MDSQVVTRKIEVSCGEARGGGSLTIHLFSANERRRRALKTLAICLVALVVGACIPGAHIILVPVIIFVSPWLVYRAWKVTSEISSVDARCAQCQGELTRLTTAERYPIFESCLSCRRENRLQPVSDYSARCNA
jgi:hypothetical protein